MTLLKIILLPLSVLYGLLISARNKAYDFNLLNNPRLSIKTIVVGNLVVGGTGKTPMVHYLASHFFSLGKNPAILSRGYKRKTSGFRQVKPHATPTDVGDEPLMLSKTLGHDSPVFVGENRVGASKKILSLFPEAKVLLLDDGMQHRSLRADITMLLTTYRSPFFADYLLPAGRLRESRKEAKRANIVVVTKCPSDLSREEANLMKKNIQPFTHPNTPVFFSSIGYEQFKAFNDLSLSRRIVLLTGIADSSPLFHFLNTGYKVIHHYNFPDHYSYKKSDIEKVITHCEREGASLVTTGKDMVKLESLIDGAQKIPVFIQPISIRFLFDEEHLFLEYLNSQLISER